MDTIRLPPDFKDFLKLLNAHGVEYLLIGGYAVIYYGHSRSTGDIDIWFAVNRQNAERLAGALRAFGFSDAITAETFLEAGKIFRMGIVPFRIELLTEISGIDFRDAYARRVRAVMDGVEVSLISLPDLKANKRASGRYKDLSDLEHLE